MDNLEDAISKLKSQIHHVEEVTYAAVRDQVSAGSRGRQELDLSKKAIAVSFSNMEIDKFYIYMFYFLFKYSNYWRKLQILRRRLKRVRKWLLNYVEISKFLIMERKTFPKQCLHSSNSNYLVCSKTFIQNYFVFLFYFIFEKQK